MINFTLRIHSKDGREYEIERKDDNSIWISDGTGVGGEFNSEKFFRCVDKFYKDNFYPPHKEIIMSDKVQEILRKLKIYTTKNFIIGE